MDEGWFWGGVPRGGTVGVGIGGKDVRTETLYKPCFENEISEVNVKSPKFFGGVCEGDVVQRLTRVILRKTKLEWKIKNPEDNRPGTIEAKIRRFKSGRGAVSPESQELKLLLLRTATRKEVRVALTKG